MSNFIERLDLIGDPTGETFLSSTIAFSATGNNANAGTLPALPKLTPSAANIASVSNVVLGADQQYGASLTINKEYRGDGRAIINGQGVDYIASSSGAVGLRNLMLINCLGAVASNQSIIPSGPTRSINNCIIKDCGEIRLTSQLSDPPLCANNVFVNTPVYSDNSSTRQTSKLQNSIFVSTGAEQTIEFVLGGGDAPNNAGRVYSNLFINYKIIATANQADFISNCYFENCSFRIDGVDYATTALVRVAHPTAFPSEVTGATSIKGDYSRGEYGVVGSDSVLLGSGFFGTNVGGVNLGEHFNELASIDAGGSSNYQFNSGVLEQINPAIVGIVQFNTIELDRVMLDPKLVFNGAFDYLNNVFRITGLSNPNKMTCKIQTADIDGILRAERVYRENYRISTDQGGLESGDDGYNELNVVRERVKFIRVKIEINT